ncbi:hypothetical protein ABT352_26165 [Streptosporangium sp. NPDC000563]|uniref:hypothetical protein n=1 Tax=unclassified Streptosporangium TaxID=2632669 RepID=UPI00331E019D
MKRALVPAPLRRAVLGWFDSRYISRADHRQDVKDALWEVQTLAREVTALRAEVVELRTRVAGVKLDPVRAGRWDDAHRLAQETAVALDGVLRNEVLLWQAVDRATGTSGTAGAPGGTGGTGGTEGAKGAASVGRGSGA